MTILTEPELTSNAPTAGDVMGDGHPSRRSPVDRLYGFLRGIPTGVLWLIVVVWSIPTLGLFVNSFRSRDGQRGTGWWKCDRTSSRPTTTARSSAPANGLGNSLLNSAAIALPATIIPIAIAAFAAYGFAWIDFKGRKPLFIGTVALLADTTPGGADPAAADVRQRSEVHDSRHRQDDHARARPQPRWHDQGGVGDAHRVRVCRSRSSCSTTTSVDCRRICSRRRASTAPTTSRSSGVSCCPLSVPVLASFAIFQFLWTWNDYLVANTMIGANVREQPTTVLIANLAGDFGKNENILPAAAFVQAFIPLMVFFALQRYFVRGILAGSVKG